MRIPTLLLDTFQAECKAEGWTTYVNISSYAVTEDRDKMDIQIIMSKEQEKETE